MTPLRPWQRDAHDQAIAWFDQATEPSRFLINAAPGAGKTLAACTIAATLLEQKRIDRVVVIAPRSEVVNQWASDFMLVTGRPMSRITGQDRDFHAVTPDLCVTWAALSALIDGFQALCLDKRVLVICDEHHHAAVAAAWGENAADAFAAAPLGLVLTGTPTRSDGGRTLWLPYDEAGGISQPAPGSYCLSYGEAVDLGYCRPVTFHRHEGRFRVRFEDGDAFQISSRSPAAIPDTHPAARALQRSLDFQKLAFVPQYDSDGRPRRDGFQASMLGWASIKLDDLRDRMPDAGGLVIAPNIGMARYFAELIEALEGERPIIVHSQLANAESRIRAFKKTQARWIVSVAMISEGVDIPRLRVLVYLPGAMTELAFRQAVGRVVRSTGPDDDTRAYVVMPAFELLDIFARRIEAEMPPIALLDDTPAVKRCPACQAECARAARACEACGHEFSERRQLLIPCPACSLSTPAGAAGCEHCGIPLAQDYVLTLDEALRDGVISRGIDLAEGELQQAETHARRVRDQVQRSGDAQLIRLLRTVPEECLSRLRAILLDGSDAGPSASP